MTQIEQIFRALSMGSPDESSLIACFYTGSEIPRACTPMSRKPCPAIDVLFDDSFSLRWRRALELNSSVHDGAVMIGRSTSSGPYYIKGWSFRLFPAEAQISAQANRGSAFNSCLAMSMELDVDALYLVRCGEVQRFRSGEASIVGPPS